MMSRYETFSSMISGIYRSIQKIERDEMVGYGYKGAYAQYLTAMNRASGGMTSAQLCELCDKDKAAVSRVVSEMIEKGLIVREQENARPYRAVLRLTEEGRKAAQFVLRRGQAAVEAVGIDETTRETLYKSLESIAQSVQEISRKGLPKE